MHVFFDEQTFVAQAQGGISRYFTELAAELGRLGVWVHVFGGISRNRYLPSLAHAPNVTARYRPRRDRLRINTWVARFSLVWRRWEFSRLRRRVPTLIYHATNYDLDPWIARRADAACLTVFDMIGELMCDAPSRARSLARKNRSVPLTDLLLCISEQTRRDFLREFPQCADRAKVTPLAASLPAPLADGLGRAERSSPYVLFVGNRSGYKNGLNALKAFAELSPAHPTLQLVCFGGEPLTNEEEQVLNAAQARKRAVAVHGDDPLLSAYYSRAAVLLYPSRYEGFGLPVLEAMQLGCPVITTRCASLPEVAGEAAIYLDPDDVRGMARAADRLLREEPWRQSWIEAGRKRAEKFSWPATARQTKAAYAEALTRRREQSRAGAAAGMRALSEPSKQ